MKSAEEFRREFPVPDESFVYAVQNQLDHLPVKEYRKQCSGRAVIAVMAALLLLTTVSAAEIMQRLGIGEFTRRTGRANLSSEALGIIAADFERQILDTPYGRVTITAAIYDGMAAYILMEVEPENDSCMVIPTTSFDGNQAWSFGRSYPKDQSIEQYAESLGYQKLLAYEVMSKETTAHFYDSQTNDDGTFSLMLWSYVRPEYRLLEELTLNLRLTVYNAAGDSLGEFEMALPIPLAGEVQRASGVPEEPALVESAGITVNRIETVTTPMATYILVHCDVTDRDVFKEYRLYSKLDFLDEYGETIPKGAQPLSFWVYASRQQMGDGTYYITNCLFDEIPMQITLGFQDGSPEMGWTDGQTWTVNLQKIPETQETLNGSIE